MSNYIVSLPQGEGPEDIPFTVTVDHEGLVVVEIDANPMTPDRLRNLASALIEAQNVASVRAAQA